MSDDEQVYRGHSFPADVEVPDDGCWTRGDAGGNEFWILGWEGHLDLAHQKGVESIDSAIVATGTGMDDIPYCAARCEVVFDGRTFSAIGSIDEPANSLEDMASTASTRAFKKAVKLALNIRKVNDTDDPDAERYGVDDSGGSVTEGPDGVEVNPPEDFESPGPGSASDSDW